MSEPTARVSELEASRMVSRTGIELALVSNRLGTIEVPLSPQPVRQFSNVVELLDRSQEG